MKSTDNKVVFYPFTTGMHQEFGEHGAPPGTLYSVTNSRLDTDGCLIKRPGMSGLTGASPAAFPQLTGNGVSYDPALSRFVTTVGDTPTIGIGNGDVFGRDSISGEFIFSGRCSTAQPVKKRKGDVGGSLTTSVSYRGHQPGVAVNSSGYVLTVSLGATATGTGKLMLETPDGTRVLFQRTIGGGGIEKIQCLAVGATFYVIWQLNAEIYGAAVSVTGGVGAGTLLGTLASSAHYWDTSAHDGTSWYLVFQSGAATVRVDKFSALTSSANTTFAVTGTCPVSIYASDDQNKVWVGYYNDPTVTGNVRYRVRATLDLAEVTAETTIVSAADIYGPPLFGEHYNATSPIQTTACRYVYRIVNTTGTMLRGMGAGVAYSDGTVATGPFLTYHCIPISKPDNYNRVWVQHCPPGGESTSLGQGRALLLRLNSATAPTIELASPLTPWLGVDGPEFSQNRFHAIARNSTKSYWAFPQALTNLTGSPLVGLTAYEYTVSDQEQTVDTEKLDTTTVIAGTPFEAFGFIDAPTSISASGVAEIGFAHRPTIISLTQTAGSGIAAGTYSYRAVYEWVDMDGRRHRSAPSLPVSITLTDVDDVTLVVSAIHMTTRRGSATTNDIAIRVYRTQNAGTSYQRLNVAGSGTTTAGITSILDQESDSSISDNEFLYTDGGVLDNVLAPSCRFLAKSEDRVWCGGLWDASIVECSKVLVPGEPVQFTGDASHQVVLPGACTGLAYMDGNVVAFTENEIYLISGDGPNDQGIGSFPPPRKMAQGVGCTSYRSVLETNVGTMFQSRRGIEMLPRGFGPVQYVGKNVRGLVQTTGLVECLGSAVYLNGKQHLARFLMGTTGATTATSVLTYDIERGEWFRDTVSQVMATFGVWPDGFVGVADYLDTSAYTYPIWYENGVQLGDGGTNAHIVQTIQTATWYPFPGGPCGWGSFNKIQIAVSPVDVATSHTISASIDVDENTAQAPDAWTISIGVGVAHREALVRVRQGSGVAVTLTDAAVTVANAGSRYLGLALELEPSGGIHIANPNNDERR